MRGMRFPLRPLLLSILPLLVLPILQGCSRSDKPVDGAAIFRTCASCHQVGVNAHGGFGPQLNGLFGRRAGSTPDYAYSPAMKASGIVWNEQTLAAFLRDPDKVVPGTRMRLWGMSDEREVAALLAHLRTYQEAH
jgi:cytochrome c